MKTIQSGLIVSHTEDGVLVQFEKSCTDAKSGHCGLCTGKLQKSGAYQMEIPAEKKIQVGKIVRVEILHPNEAVAALVVFGLPLICAIVGGILGYLLVHWENDLGIVLFGGVGLFVGFGFVALFSRCLSGLQPVARILGEDES